MLTRAGLVGTNPAITHANPRLPKDSRPFETQHGGHSVLVAAAPRALLGRVPALDRSDRVPGLLPVLRQQISPTTMLQSCAAILCRMTSICAPLAVLARCVPTCAQILASEMQVPSPTSLVAGCSLSGACFLFFRLNKLFLSHPVSFPFLYF